MSSDNPPDTPNPAPAPAASRPARGGPSLLSVIALLIALLTAAYVIYRDPPWGRLAKYNFSTPEQALRSQTKMEANADILSLIELNIKREQKQLKEKLNTLEVKRTAEFEGKTVLFIQYKMTDKNAKEPKEPTEHKEVVWYEKEENGYWQQTAPPRALQTGDPQLAKDINAWSGRGGFQMPPGFGE